MHHDATPVRARRGWALVVLAALVLQVLLAAGMLFGPRPSPYGWQMYSAAPPRPEGFALQDGRLELIDVEGWLTHARVEVDHAAVLRTNGCEQTGADAIRIEFPDGTVDEVTCR